MKNLRKRQYTNIAGVRGGQIPPRDVHNSNKGRRRCETGIKHRVQGGRKKTPKTKTKTEQKNHFRS